MDTQVEMCADRYRSRGQTLAEANLSLWCNATLAVRICSNVAEYTDDERR